MPINYLDLVRSAFEKARPPQAPAQRSRGGGGASGPQILDSSSWKANVQIPPAVGSALDSWLRKKLGLGPSVSDLRKKQIQVETQEKQTGLLEGAHLVYSRLTPEQQSMARSTKNFQRLMEMGLEAGYPGVTVKPEFYGQWGIEDEFEYKQLVELGYKARPQDLHFGPLTPTQKQQLEQHLKDLTEKAKKPGIEGEQAEKRVGRFFGTLPSKKEEAETEKIVAETGRATAMGDVYTQQAELLKVQAEEARKKLGWWEGLSAEDKKVIADYPHPSTIKLSEAQANNYNAMAEYTRKYKPLEEAKPSEAQKALNELWKGMNKTDEERMKLVGGTLGESLLENPAVRREINLPWFQQRLYLIRETIMLDRAVRAINPKATSDPRIRKEGEFLFDQLYKEIVHPAFKDAEWSPYKKELYRLATILFNETDRKDWSDPERTIALYLQMMDAAGYQAPVPPYRREGRIPELPGVK